MTDEGRVFPVWHLYAFTKDLPGDYRESVPEWGVEHAVKFAIRRGFESVLVERDPELTAVLPRLSVPGITHHG